MVKEKNIKRPILDGQLLTNIELVIGTNVIPHGLGRPALGAIPVLWKEPLDGLSTDQTSNRNPSLHLYIQSTTANTVSLWVF